MYKVKFSGKKIEDLTLNGNCFVSNTTLTEVDFEKLGTVEIYKDGELTETIKDAVLVTVQPGPEGTYFAFRTKTIEEKRAEDMADMQSAIMELAAMIAKE